MTATARFDDQRPGRRRSFALDGTLGTIVAHRPGEVRGAIAAAEAEVRAGHWVAGWVSYEAAPALDASLTVRPVTETGFSELPLVWFLVARSRATPEAEGRLDAHLSRWDPMVPERQHLEAVEEVRRRIRVGDTYQVNLTFMLTSRFRGDPGSLYRQLIRSQSCGYGALIDTGRWVVASASPELFFEWRNGILTCRPMKGTTRRGVDPVDDERRRAWLESSEKNRAENLMIVDMVRNDLGRIGRIGSVQVPSLFSTEKYDTVWQMTSTVTARPRPGTDLSGVLEALFPAASITGAPKAATSRIISELETHPRGVYCGAIGFGRPGPEGPEWSFSVGIRTVLIDRRTSTAFYGTGGGITYDSEPGDEYQEARLKAELLQRPAGDLSLVETTRWDPRLGPRHLARHLQRAAASADYFDIPFDPAEVRAAIGRAVKERREPARLRVLVDRDGWVTVEAGELEASLSPIRLAIDDRPIDPSDPFVHHKTTMRRVHQEAARRHPDADDVVLWNPRGEITETTIGNLAVLIDGEWVTPPLSSGLLAGTERATRLASEELTERVVTLPELRTATGLARLNSVRGWEEATLI